MTDKNTGMTVDLVILTYNRADDIVETLKSILPMLPDFNRVWVVNNNSTDDTAVKLEQFCGHEKIVICNPGENLGCTGGRNYAIRRSTADIIINIDDDAVFFTPEPVSKVKAIFSAEPECAHIAFKIVNYFTREVQKKEFPAPMEKVSPDEEFKSSFFIGAGWASRRSVLNDVGLFDEELFIYHDELDISFRIINRGHYIKFTPQIGVYHKQTPSGREPAGDTLKRFLKNRLAISYKYLPLHIGLVSNFLWCAKILKMSKSPRLVLAAIGEYYAMKPKLTVEKISPSTISYLKENFGRLYY